MTALPKPPKHLQTAGKALWNSLNNQFELVEPHHLQLLERACEQEDRIAGYRAVLAAQGATTQDRWGQTKPHPLLVEERAATNLQRLLLRELGLDHAGSPNEAARMPRGSRYNGA